MPGASFCLRVLLWLTLLEVEEPEQTRCRDDPRELVPVEEGEAQQGRRGAHVYFREAQAEVRQCKQQ